MNKLTKYGIKPFDTIAIFFSVFWIFVVFIDYLNKHPLYYESILNFKYPKLVVFHILYGGLVVWLLGPNTPVKKTWKKRLFVPLFLFSILTSILALIAGYSKYYESSIGWDECFHILGLSLFVLASSFIIFFVCHLLGRTFSSKVLSRKVIFNSHFTIDIALGIFFYTFLLFILGSIHLLNSWSCLLLSVVIIGLNFKSLTQTIANIFTFNPQFSSIQLVLLYTCLVFCVVNFVFILGPFPLGFDSRNYYLNIPQLITENQGLVMGFQPYNWELFSSLGMILFKKIEVSMFLSQFGGVLAGLSVYQLSHGVLKLNKTHAIFTTLIFLVTPAISRQMHIELKVDLALLFFQLVTLHLFISHLMYKKKTENSHYSFAIVIGLLLGFGLGIKILNFFLIFGILAVLALDKKDIWGLGFIILFGLGAILFLKLDDQTGLRNYHKYADVISYLLLGAGIICASFYFFKKRAKAKIMITQMCIIFAICLLTFSPWMIKTYLDTGKTDLLFLVRGAGSGHDMNQKKITEIYNQMISDDE